MTGFTTKLAETPDEVRAAQRVRYDVFVQEMGSDGPDVDHTHRLEKDRFDEFCDHMLLIDESAGKVVGVYRLLRGEMAQRAGEFYSQSEYRLDPLIQTGRPLLELGRSCVYPAYRNGLGMQVLWAGLADYVIDHNIEILFGVASLHGTDLAAHAGPLSLLHHRHLAPEALRVRAQPEAFQPMDLIAPEALDRKAAMVALPSLIKAYLRLGGCVGEGAYIDHDFNTIDVCMILDTARLSDKAARFYTSGVRE